MDFELILPEVSEAVEPHTLLAKEARKWMWAQDRRDWTWRGMVLTPGGKTIMTNPTKAN